MPTYEEYKQKVYEIFLRDFLTNLNKEEKIKYLEENEDLIQRAYKGDVYRYKEMKLENVFTDDGIASTVCNNLDMLY